MSVNMTARNPEVHGGRRRARGRARIADAAEERLDGGKIDRNDGVGDFTMRLTMDSLGGRGVRRMDEAEGGAIVLVEPIGHVFYAVSVLNVDVPAVRLGDIVRLHAAQVVAVHENRHVISLASTMGQLETTISASASACKDSQRSRKWGKVPTSRSATADDGTTAERVLSPCRNDDAKRSRCRRIVLGTRRVRRLPCHQERPTKALQRALTASGRKSGPVAADDGLRGL